ncbi:MAG: MlaA family lipoprotein [bacterium]
MKKQLLIVLCSVSLLSACSLAPDKAQPTQDHWENFNRKTFAFNESLDKNVVKPVVKGYKAVTPDFAEKGIHNFFANLGDLGNAFNNLLQLKPGEAGHDLTRFAFNSTFGLAGFIDVASVLQMEKHNEDFGQTLATWGVAPGPYVVLPFLGPSTLRDTGGRIVDTATDPITYADDMDGLKPLQLIDIRAGLLATEATLEDVSVDKYALVRDAWLKNRAYLITDGKSVTKVDPNNDLAAELEALD